MKVNFWTKILRFSKFMTETNDGKTIMFLVFLLLCLLMRLDWEITVSRIEQSNKENNEQKQEERKEIRKPIRLNEDPFKKPARQVIVQSRKCDWVDVLVRVESRGNNFVIGDTHLSQKAYGPLQVRQVCVDDINSRFGTNLKAEQMLGNLKLSRWVCRAYISIYCTEDRLGRKPTIIDAARIWNGGPDGWKKTSTLAYAEKVRRELNKKT